jgi:hypothetical protein
MRTYLIGPFLAFLPQAWRDAYFRDWEVDWPRAAAFSGLLEGFAAFVALVVWYSIYVTRIGQIIGGAGGHLAGYVGLFSTAMHPLTWIICYFGCEGAVRLLAAVVNGESYGTLPLWLLSRRGNKAGVRGKAIADRVISGGTRCDLEVSSFRPKENWKYPLTIRYQDNFFQVTGQESKPLSELRPYVYFLRRLPSDEIIKGLEPYDPNVIPEDQPGFFETVLTEIRRPK